MLVNYSSPPFFHERTKVALKEYALENNKPEVKPVMLVVAKDIAHASALRTLIDSDQFRGGAYKGKVIEVHTKTKEMKRTRRLKN